MTDASKTIVVAGASGVIGAAAVEHFARRGYLVTAISRRKPVLPQEIAFRHVSLDLTSAGDCQDAVSEIGGAALFVYAAVAEARGLSGGWVDTDLIEQNACMFDNLALPLAKSGTLRWAGLLQGTKAYGAHLHPISLPAREDQPRDDHDNFYFRQEDRLRELAEQHGFAWTLFRPQIVFGGAAGAAMNPVAAIGAYAALCREMRRPFAYPGVTPNIWEVTDAGLLAEAFAWAAQCDEAAGQIFNVTNGDIFVVEHDWPVLAQAMGLAVAERLDCTLAEFFSTDEAQSAWRTLAQRHGLVLGDLDAVLGQSHSYVDLLLDPRMSAPGRLPVLVSSIKIRQAGFGGCRDSLESMLSWLRWMGDARLLPPDLFDHAGSQSRGPTGFPPFT